MKQGWIGVAACVIAITIVPHFAHGQNIEKDVLVLNDDTLNATLNTAGQATLLEIYAPWCHHCQALTPEYGAAATTVKEAGLPVVLAKVDGTESPKTSAWLGVKGYPTLIWFDGEVQMPYPGKRTGEGIAQWVKKRKGPPAETLSTVAQLEKAIQQSEVFLLGFFTASKSDLHEAYLRAVKGLEKWPIYQTDSSEVAQRLNLSQPNSIALGTSFEAFGKDFRAVTSDDHPAFQSQTSLEEQILKFVDLEDMPPFLPYTNDNSDRIFSLPRQVFILGPSTAFQPGQDNLEAIMNTQPRFRGQVAFSTALLGTDAGEMITNFFGISSDSPSLQVLGFYPEKEKFRLLEPLTEDSLFAFCKGMQDHTYPRLYRSMPIPAKPEDAYVHVVVGKTFDQVVLDEEKDVLLLLYAKWSEKSKHVTATWRRVARHLRKVDRLCVAKFEASENEHEAVDIDAVPSIFMYPAGPNKTGIKMVAQDPTFKGILRFAKQHASRPIEISTSQAQSTHEEL